MLMQHHSSEHPFPPPLLVLMRNSPRTFPDCSIGTCILFYLMEQMQTARPVWSGFSLPVVYDDDVRPRPPRVLPARQMLSVLQKILSPLGNKDAVPSR